MKIKKTTGNAIFENLSTLDVSVFSLDDILLTYKNSARAKNTKVMQHPVKTSIDFEYDVLGISYPKSWQPILISKSDKVQTVNRSLDPRFSQKEVHEMMTKREHGI